MFSYFSRTASISTLAIKVAPLVTVLLAIFGSSVVHAQDGIENRTDERLLACDKISDPAEKMECFDAVVQGLKQTDATPATEPPSTQPPLSDTPSVTAPAAVVGVTAAAPPAAAPDPKPAAASPSAVQNPTAASEPQPATESQSVATAPAAAVPAAESQSETPVPAPAEAPVEAEKAPEAGLVLATVVSAQNVGDERFLVQLDNGQVWQENGGFYIGLPKVGTPVEITKGRFGGYKMKIGSANKRVPVKRTK